MYLQEFLQFPITITPEKRLSCTINQARYYNMIDDSEIPLNFRIVEFDEIVQRKSIEPVYVHLPKEYADTFIQYGTIKFGTLKEYRESQKTHSADINEGRTITWVDDELNTSVRVGGISSGYLVYCTSKTSTKNERLMKFGDSTIRINQPGKFFQLVAEKLKMSPIHFGDVLYSPLNAMRITTDKIREFPNPLNPADRYDTAAQIALSFVKRPCYEQEQEVRFMWRVNTPTINTNLPVQIPEITSIIDRIC